MSGRLVEKLFGSAETRRLVRENLHDKPTLMAVGRAYNASLPTILVYGYVLAMLMIGMIKPEYPQLGRAPVVGASVLVSDLITAAKTALYWAISWAITGHFSYPILRRGLPYILVPLVMFAVAVLVSELVSLLTVPGAEITPSRMARQMATALPGTVIAVMGNAQMLRERLGHDPELVPIWLPIRNVGVPLLLRAPADRRGALLRIHAANQYVEVVTDKGTALIRMPLHQAVNLVPEDLGWTCHRSMWIARSEVVALSYERGQPQITDRHGQIWPISRKAVADIRDHLDRLDAQAG